MKYFEALIFTVIGGYLILRLLQNKHLHTTPQMWILALGDLCFMLLVVFFVGTTQTQQYSPIGLWLALPLGLMSAMYNYRLTKLQLNDQNRWMIGLKLIIGVAMIWVMLGALYD